MYKPLRSVCAHVIHGGCAHTQVVAFRAVACFPRWEFLEPLSCSFQLRPSYNVSVAISQCPEAGAEGGKLSPFECTGGSSALQVKGSRGNPGKPGLWLRGPAPPSAPSRPVNHQSSPPNLPKAHPEPP